jgi:hypothetical protein
VIKVFGYMSKRADITTAAFRDHYENIHVPLVLTFAPLPRVYKRNYLDGGDPQGLTSPEIGFDVITEFVFDSHESLEAWGALAEVPEIIADELTFLDRDKTRAYVIQEGVSAPW